MAPATGEPEAPTHLLTSREVSVGDTWHWPQQRRHGYGPHDGHMRHPDRQPDAERPAEPVRVDSGRDGNHVGSNRPSARLNTLDAAAPDRDLTRVGASQDRRPNVLGCGREGAHGLRRVGVPVARAAGRRKNRGRHRRRDITDGGVVRKVGEL